MDFGNLNTDWVLVITVIVCTWFLGMKIHHLMQDMVVLGKQTEKDREEYRYEVLKSLEAIERGVSS
jgi:hypothetical protein